MIKFVFDNRHRGEYNNREKIGICDTIDPELDDVGALGCEAGLRHSKRACKSLRSGRVIAYQFD